MNCDVWLNGRHLGNHPYGYTSFWYDISDFIRTGEKTSLLYRYAMKGRTADGTQVRASTGMYGSGSLIRFISINWVL